MRLYFLGFHLRSLSNKVVELKITYDAYGENLQCKIDKPNQGKKCSFVFNIPKDMDPPVLVYYEIDNFYQNHREVSSCTLLNVILSLLKALFLLRFKSR